MAVTLSVLPSPPTVLRHSQLSIIRSNYKGPMSRTGGLATQERPLFTLSTAITWARSYRPRQSFMATRLQAPRHCSDSCRRNLRHLAADHDRLCKRSRLRAV